MEYEQIQNFMGYLKRQFSDVLNNHWNWDFMENTIQYVNEYEDDIKTAAINICELIPELNEHEKEKLSEYLAGEVEVDIVDAEDLEKYVNGELELEEDMEY